MKLVRANLQETVAKPAFSHKLFATKVLVLHVSIAACTRIGSFCLSSTYTFKHAIALELVFVKRANSESGEIEAALCAIKKWLTSFELESGVWLDLWSNKAVSHGPCKPSFEFQMRLGRRGSSLIDPSVTLRCYIKACQLQGNGYGSLERCFCLFLIYFNMPYDACFHGLCSNDTRKHPGNHFHSFPQTSENNISQEFACR